SDPITEQPERRSAREMTWIQNEPQASKSTEPQALKSTRHLLIYARGHGLNSTCFSDRDCSVQGSTCFSNRCACAVDRVQTPDGAECVLRGDAISNEVDWPGFSGRSYLAFPPLKGDLSLHLEMELKSFAHNGVLFYDQGSEDGTGDFLALSLIDGHVELRYDLGSGSVRIKSPERVKPGTWHRVRAQRYRQDGRLVLDEGTWVSGSSPGHLTSLNVKELAYVGYVPTQHQR
ncbi:unnamed protein product, partial [Darwinula stevensoni]